MIYDDLWIEVDFLTNKHVRGVVTQGRENLDQRVNSYMVMYKKDGQSSFTTIEDGNDRPKVSNYLVRWNKVFKKKFSIKVAFGVA